MLYLRDPAVATRIGDAVSVEQRDRRGKREQHHLEREIEI